MREPRDPSGRNGCGCILDFHDRGSRCVSGLARNMVFVGSAPSSRPARVNDFNCRGHCSDINSNGYCPACAPALLALHQTLMLKGASYDYVLPF